MIDAFTREFSEQYRAALPRYECLFPYELRFRDKGNALGQVHSENGVMIFSFSREAIERFPEHMYKVCIPHELAHAINWQVNRGKGHGRAWRKICVALGGNGETYHDLPVTPAKVSREFLYVLDRGTRVQLKTVRHNRIQAETAKYSTNGEKIRKHHFVREL